MARNKFVKRRRNRSSLCILIYEITVNSLICVDSMSLESAMIADRSERVEHHPVDSRARFSSHLC